MAIIIKTSDSVNIKDSVVKVDPQLFFQRLIVSIQPEEGAFSCELCTRPSSLFDKKGLINEAHKPELKSALFNQRVLSEYIIPHILQNIYYVLDGVSLLQKLPRTVLPRDTFDEICQSFKNYFLNNYGAAESITVNT